jgi:hypothetical protein
MKGHIGDHKRSIGEVDTFNAGPDRRSLRDVVFLLNSKGNRSKIYIYSEASEGDKQTVIHCSRANVKLQAMIQVA